MAFQDKLKTMAHWTAALSAMVTMQAGAVQSEPDNVHQNAPVESITRPATEYLDYRVKRGTLVNGETGEERRQKWQQYKKEHGAAATVDAIYDEKLTQFDIVSKDGEGYNFQTYRPEGSSSYESYYPNGVLRSKMTGNGDEAEGYYPDGSKKFDRTVGGVETRYHPGGQKGHEKIKETPHGLTDSFDVLDKEGRIMEHHYALTDSNRPISEGGTLLKDVKKVDLYNPEPQKVVGTYTLDDWSIGNGRIASIGYVDEHGVMKTLDLPRAKKIGDTNHYAKRLSLKRIKKLYQEVQQERSNQMALEKGMKDALSAKR